MFKRPPYIALGVVVLLVVIFLTLPRQASAQLKLALGSLFLPLFGLASATEKLAERAVNNVTPRSTLLSQVEKLRQENQELRLQAMQNEVAVRENAQLRQQLGFQKQSSWKLKPARLIGRDEANWWRTVKIDFGAQDGARVNLPVLTSEGLVGRIAEVGLNFAQVTLVGDPNCKVAVQVVETREQGMIIPSSPSTQDHTLVDLTYLPRNSALKTGHKVITSGIGGIFPQGIAVGEVVDYRNVNFGLYQTARVKLKVDSSKLENVWVKLP